MRAVVAQVVELLQVQAQVADDGGKAGQQHTHNPQLGTTWSSNTPRGRWGSGGLLSSRTW